MFYDDNYNSGGSTEIEGYYDTITKEIIKVVEMTYYDWAEDETAYYYRQGQLFFIYSKGNSPGEMYTAQELEITEEELWERGGEAKSLNFYEDRYYYHDKKCIRHLNKSKLISVEDEADLSEVPNEKIKIEEKVVLSIQSHGYKLFQEFNKQIKPKK